MGLWWKTVEEVPKGGISIKGNPNAWPKWNPFWRFQHKWKIIEVDSAGRPYFVYFDDGVVKMRFKQPIKTRYFAARIGSRDLIFSATSNLSDLKSFDTISNAPSTNLYTWFQIYCLSSSEDVEEVTMI